MNTKLARSNEIPLEILLVEDNFDHATLVLRTLEEHHISNRVHHVRDGEQALDYLFRGGRWALY